VLRSFDGFTWLRDCIITQPFFLLVRWAWYAGSGMKGKDITIQITSGTVVLVLFYLAVAWFLYEIRDILLIVISAVIFSMALAPGKRFFARFKVPEPIAVVILYTAAFLVLSYFLYSLLPIVLQQYQIFLESLPSTVAKIKGATDGTVFDGIITTQSIQALVNSPQQITDTVQRLLQVGGIGVFSLFGGLVNITLFFLLTFLFAVNPKSLDTFLFVITPPKYREYVKDLWGRVQVKMSQWFQGQALLMLIIGVLTYLALVILGVPNALFLSVFAGVMEIIPIFGPIFGAIPAVLMAWTSGSLTTVFFVVALFIIIQQLENNLIYPLVVSKVVGVSSILIILAAVVGGAIAGFVGVVIAVPLAGIVQEFFADVRDGTLEKLRG